MLFGVPYAYATMTSSSYQVVSSQITLVAGSTLGGLAQCNSGDYATGGGAFPNLTETGFGSNEFIVSSFGVTNGGLFASNGVAPNGWRAVVENPTTSDNGFYVVVVCQSPITVAGVTVPEFGQLYVAIALGAMVYFLMARRFSGPRTIGTKTSQA